VVVILLHPTLRTPIVRKDNATVHIQRAIGCHWDGVGVGC
jgi:hypothetical protein